MFHKIYIQNIIIITIFQINTRKYSGKKKTSHSHWCAVILFDNKNINNRNLGWEKSFKQYYYYRLSSYLR